MGGSVKYDLYLPLKRPCHFHTSAVEGCTGGGVANKGQSESYVRKNPVIADVVSSLGKIEKILGKRGLQ